MVGKRRGGRPLAGLAALSMLCACAGLHVGSGDRPGRLSPQQLQKFETALAPHVQKAREGLPEVKRRYQAGLPEGEVLHVTVRLADGAGRFEQAYVQVEDWYADDLIGRVSSRTETVQGYGSREVISFKERAILDWVITKPDGMEEGNFVGRFLESYKQ